MKEEQEQGFGGKGERGKKIGNRQQHPKPPPFNTEEKEALGLSPLSVRLSVPFGAAGAAEGRRWRVDGRSVGVGSGDQTEESECNASIHPPRLAQKHDKKRKANSAWWWTLEPV